MTISKREDDLRRRLVAWHKAGRPGATPPPTHADDCGCVRCSSDAATEPNPRRAAVNMKRGAIVARRERVMVGTKGWTTRWDEGPFRVMAVADGYAMCRRPGCVPFVAQLGDLRPVAS